MSSPHPAFTPKTSRSLKWLQPIPGFFEDPPTNDALSDPVPAADFKWQTSVPEVHDTACLVTVTGPVAQDSRAWYEYQVLQPESIMSPRTFDLPFRPKVQQPSGNTPLAGSDEFDYFTDEQMGSPTPSSLGLDDGFGRSEEFANEYLAMRSRGKNPDSIKSPEMTATHMEEPWSPPMERPFSTMTKFLAFPEELRMHVYRHLVVSDGPIRPELCTRHPLSRPHFHDHARAHNAVYRSLAITYTSKQVRKEVLGVFYGENTFAWTHDLATYLEFMRLTGRIQMIHQVHFSVDFFKEAFVSKMIRQLTRVIKEQEDWKAEFLRNGALIERTKKEASWMPDAYEPDVGPMDKDATEQADLRLFQNITSAYLQKMPLHRAGGLEPFSTMLIFRNLSFAREGHAAPGEEDLDREIAIRVPAASMFNEYHNLMWFPKMVASMGIKLKMLSGGQFDYMSGTVGIDWVRRYQRKGVDMQMDQLGPLEREKVMQRAEKMFEGLEHLGDARPTAYYRRKCGGLDIEWYRVD